MSRHGGVYLHVRDRDLLHRAKGNASTTFAELALAAQCSPGFLCDLATGAKNRVDANLAARIEDALDVPRGHLFGLNPADSELLTPYMPAADAVA